MAEEVVDMEILILLHPALTEHQPKHPKLRDTLLPKHQRPQKHPKPLPQSNMPGLSFTRLRSHPSFTSRLHQFPKRLR